MSMCKCIPGVDVCNWCGPGKRTYDTQAAELIATPVNQIDRTRPERVDNTRLLTHFSPSPAPPVGYGNQSPQEYVRSQGLPSLPHIFQYSSPLSALSLGGVVPFNVCAVIFPLERFSFLLNAREATMQLSQLFNGGGAMGGFPGFQWQNVNDQTSPINIDQYWIMRPGEVVNFGRLLNGFCGFWIAPWSGIAPVPGGNSDLAKSTNNVLNMVSQATIAQRNFALLGSNPLWGDNGGQPGGAGGIMFSTGPTWAPEFRAHYTPAQTMTMPCQKAPWVLPAVNLNKPLGSVCIPPGSKTVTVSLQTGTVIGTTGNSYQNTSFPLTSGYIQRFWHDANFCWGRPGRVAAGSWELAVEWYGFDGVIHKHPSDHWNPSGRGYASPEHDIEIYDIPRVAAALNVYWNTSGTAQGSNITTACYTFSGGD